MKKLILPLALGLLTNGIEDARAAEAPVRVAVMNIEARGVPEDVVALVGEVLAAELTKQAGFQVVSASSLKSAVDLEQRRQMLGCDGDDCYTYLGGLLRAEQLVTGSIDRVGETYLVNLQIIHSQRAEVLSRTSFEAPREHEGLVGAVRKGVEELLQKPARLHLYGQVDHGRVLLDDQLVGVMPLKPFPINRSGSATLRVEHYDYPPAEYQLDLERGRTTRVRLDMQSYVELESSAKRRRVAGWLTAGASVLAFTGGALLVAQGYSISSDYDSADLRRTSQADLDAMAGDARAYLAGGYTALGVGAVALGTSLWLILGGSPPEYAASSQ